MRAQRTIVAVAVGSALLGGLAALGVAKVTGLTNRATTVYVPTTGGSGLGLPSVVSRAKPLLGNGFRPARIYAARAPGVVTVFSFFSGHEAQGSGFVVSKSGYVLTSAHVVTDAGDTAHTTAANDVYVGFKDGDRTKATIVGWDVYDDVALLSIDPSQHALSPVPLGNSALVRAGDPVAAMGSPFGNEDSIAVGVVSAIRRSIASLTSIYRVVDAIQIDAPITHGNSGGPLFDARGRVIGINAQIRSDTGQAEGVGFAIPINAAKRSMAQLAATGHVAYAFLGVTTGDLTPSLARHFGYAVSRGALVSAVDEGGPAAKAGLHGGQGEARFEGQTITPGGDIIVAIDGRPVSSADDVVRDVGSRLPGETITLTVVRGKERKTLRVRLGARSDSQGTNP